MASTKTETVKHYQTAKGSHRHQDWHCANQRRSIQTGAVTEIPADKVSQWPACEHCCPVEEVRESAKAAAAKADEMCANTGVANPRHIQSTCNDCGKRGSVNRSTGKLRGHKPAKAAK